jgi:hypothetical protein
MRRRIRDTDDEPQEEEEEKSNDLLRGSTGPTGKRGGERERGRRWD